MFSKDLLGGEVWMIRLGSCGTALGQVEGWMIHGQVYFELNNMGEP
jgi:hypothetical protein